MKILGSILLVFAFAFPVYPATVLPISCLETLLCIGQKTDNCNIKIVICIELGRKRKGCTGLGICDIDVYIDGRAINNNQVKADAWMEGGKLQVNFDKSSMSYETYQTYFGTGSFKMEEDFVLPPEIVTALGINSYTVRTGNYAISLSTTNSDVVSATF